MLARAATWWTILRIALEERLVQLAQDPVRDKKRMALVEPWWS